MMKVDKKLYDSVVDFIEERFGKNSDEGAAGIYTSKRFQHTFTDAVLT
jgi:ribosomal protein S24E